MQESQKEPSPVPQKKSLKARLSLLIKVLRQGRTIWRVRREDPQAGRAEETVTNFIRSIGASEEGIGHFKSIFDFWREFRRDDETSHTVNRYFVGGIGILDLVLFQVLVSVGHPDLASSLSWVAFAISLPCTVGSLFLSFFNKANGITIYNNLHSTMSLLSQVSTLVSATALICHVWLVPGLLFFFIAVIVTISCLFYVTLVLLKRPLQITKLSEIIDKQVVQVSTEMKPTDAKLIQNDESINRGD